MFLKKISCGQLTVELISCLLLFKQHPSALGCVLSCHSFLNLFLNSFIQISWACIKNVQDFRENSQGAIPIGMIEYCRADGKLTDALPQCCWQRMWCFENVPSFGGAESRELEGNGAGSYPTYSTFCYCASWHCVMQLKRKVALSLLCMRLLSVLVGKMNISKYLCFISWKCWHKYALEWADLTLASN